MQQSGSSDRDAFVHLGRSVRNAFFATKAFIDALLDSEAWARFARRVFKRLVIIAIVAVLFAGVAWKYSTEIFLWLLRPAEGRLTPFEDGLPIFTAPQDMFAVTVGLAFRAGFLAAAPAIMVSVYTLFNQWLPSSARTFLKIFVPSVFLAFAAGIAFVYYVILPRSLEFLLSFNKGVAVAMITVTNYFDLVLSLMFWMGVVFELPLVMYLLVRLGLVSYRKLKWARLAIWIAAPFFAAIITPTFDIYTWSLVMVPLIILYEVGLFLAWLARPEEGNYLWLGTISRAVTWVLRWIKRIVLSPYTVPRWAIRKVLRR